LDEVDSRAIASIMLLAAPVTAQWLKRPDPTIPRTRTKANLPAATPKSSESKPDLSGIWLPDPDRPETRVENAIQPGILSTSRRT
jgi:hypothetical protein